MNWQAGDAREGARLRAASRDWPSLAVHGEAAAGLELMLRGALAGHMRFMKRDEYEAVRDRGQLPDGTPWPAPLLLPAPPALASTLHAGGYLALRDREGLMLAALRLDETWELSGTAYVAGAVTGIQLPPPYSFAHLRHTTGQLRETPDGTAVLATEPIHREAFDALMARGESVLIVGALPPGADPATTHPTVRCWLHAVERSHGRLRLSLWPLAAPHTVHGRFLAECIARRAGCESLLLEKDLPGAEAHREAVGLLRQGLKVPEALTFPAVARELASVYPPPAEQGLTIFFTGLSGSGKSTIANALREALLERGGRRVTLLDGDLVRHHLSSELGFSREHRALNVTRIGFVAAEITRHRGIAICAPIAPYEELRNRVRAMVELNGHFVLVYVATSLTECEKRDVKGLYAKARKGLIPNFTGVSDVYEPPENAEIVIDTAALNPAEAAEAIVTWLERHGLLAG